jgi:hypothetical protein
MSREPESCDWSTLMGILKWMQSEGLVELFYDEAGRECVRITPEGMKFEFGK